MTPEEPGLKDVRSADHLQGFGWANLEARVNSTPHTPFSLASIAKPFTATTIMTLLAEGKLALDEPRESFFEGMQACGHRP